MSKPRRELLAHRSNVYSQNGEDGVLAEIFRRLGREPQWVVEFGAWDGRHMSNSWRLLEAGANGVLIEADPVKYEELVSNVAGLDGDVTPLNAFVTPGPDSNLAELLGSTSIPKDFDLLSLDTDGPDVPIWQALAGFEPKVVCVETNGIVPPEELISVDGSSLVGACRVGTEKGYRLVCHTGNGIFVREDLVDQLGLAADEIDNPELLFDPYFRPKSIRRAAWLLADRDGRWRLRGDLRASRKLLADDGLKGLQYILYHHVYTTLVPESIRQRVTARRSRQG
ncbi:MAG TPA: hypothetical protein VFB41_11295 [Solirubrobacteraceae bacterium]|nr:hypothetical protein [Solirubrobacteraceae bacterium]